VNRLLSAVGPATVTDPADTRRSVTDQQSMASIVSFTVLLWPAI
jgi:hypothetical protein